MSKNQFTGTAAQRNRNATANFVNLIRTSTVVIKIVSPRGIYIYMKSMVINKEIVQDIVNRIIFNHEI